MVRGAVSGIGLGIGTYPGMLQYGTVWCSTVWYITNKFVSSWAYLYVCWFRHYIFFLFYYVTIVYFLLPGWSLLSYLWRCLHCMSCASISIIHSQNNKTKLVIVLLVLAFFSTLSQQMEGHTGVLNISRKGHVQRCWFCGQQQKANYFHLIKTRIQIRCFLFVFIGAKVIAWEKSG